MPSSASFQMRAIAFLCLLGLTAGQSGLFNWPSKDKSDDPISTCEMNDAACGCCQMQKQMHKMEKFFNMSLNELQVDLHKTQDSLNRAQASRGAFSVALTSEHTCEGPFRDDTIVDYQYIFLNEDNNYSGGIYTAPWPGVYILAVTVYADAGGAGNSLHACAILRINGAIVAVLSDVNLHDSKDSSTIVVARRLNKGDKVYVNQPIGCILCDNKSHYNTFTGYLLYLTDQ